MAAQEVHKSDVGTIFEATIKDDDVVVDISASSSRQLIFKKPSGAAVTKAAVLSGNGADGKMRYVTIAGDLDEVGLWKLQGQVTIGAGTWRTDVYAFQVFDNL